MDRLAKALDAAATALTEQQSNATTQGASGQTGATGPGSTGSTGTTGAGGGSGGGGSGGGGTQSTASLEVAVLQATQDLAGAEQDLDGAVLKAPVSGRVGQVDLVAGEQASTSAGVVIVGPGGAVVTVDLPLAQLGTVRVAQDVTVTPAGTTDAVPGLVQSIGVLPSSTTTSTPTYPVRVTVSDAPVSLASGSTATVSITLATASDVLTVPVSAVTGVRSGTGSVQVLSNGTVQAARVTVGAVGQGRVQVEQGPDRRAGRRAGGPVDGAAEQHGQQHPSVGDERRQQPDRIGRRPGRPPGRLRRPARRCAARVVRCTHWSMRFGVSYNAAVGAGPDPVALKGISLDPCARLGELYLAPDLPIADPLECLAFVAASTSPKPVQMLPIHAGYGRRSQPFS